MNRRILAIDAGNTRIKCGLHDGRTWLLHHAVDIADVESGVAFCSADMVSEIDLIVISNVAGPSVGKAIEHQLQPLHKPISVVTARASQCGVVNGYESPLQLGSDRWAALIGARAAAKNESRAQLVIMCGTALTVDALAADGYFLGGIIVPGLELMQRALNQGTAQLPAEHGVYECFPGNTINAITSGALEACAGAVTRMHAHLSARTGEVPCIIGSGGAMGALAPHLPFPVSINDNLVLDGLLVMASAT
ncbi:MAG: type III pantothenate kinase [Burkholderiales bacterium]|nr:type III pantothenate kinase [Burkholderiales bacterium]